MSLIITIVVSFALYQLIMYFFKRDWHKRLDTFLSFETPVLRVGEESTLTETIENNGPISLPSLELKFDTAPQLHFKDSANSVVTDRYYRRDIFSIHTRQRITRKLRFTPTKRGYYTIKRYDLITRDFFMKNSYIMNRDTDLSLYVYPRHLNSFPMDWIQRQVSGDRKSKARFEEDPFHLRGLREYVPGDSYRAVNWKSSARHNELIVNLFEPIHTMKAYVILDLATAVVADSENVKEHAITVTSSIINHLLKEGTPVDFYTNGYDTFTGEKTNPVFSEDALSIDDYDKSLALLDEKKSPKNISEILDGIMTKPERNAFYLFISGIRYRDMNQLLEKYQNDGLPIYGILPYTGRDHSVIFDGVKGNYTSSILPWKM